VQPPGATGAQAMRALKALAVALLVGLTPTSLQSQAMEAPSPSVVLGDPGGFVDGDPFHYRDPFGVAIDRSVTPNRLYIADGSNNRVLGFNSIAGLTNGAAPDVIIGQPDLLSSEPNHGGTSASSLRGPQSVAVDASGNLYVADTENNRVLEYDTPFTSDTIADRVFGQAGSFSTSDCAAVSATSLCSPYGVALDPAGDLYVADYENNRVLEFDDPLGNATADRVFGQGGFQQRREQRCQC